MSDNLMLSKMDALMKKHRGGNESTPSAAPTPLPPRTPDTPSAPPTGAWLPVLTQVIERGTPPAAATPVVKKPAATAETESMPGPAAPASGERSPAIVSTELSEQLMSELTPRLSEVMEKQLAAELRKNLDQTVATLLSQLDVNVREIVREAVAEKLKQPHDPSN
ncbi:MAG: hypothetical protein IV085_05690 [Thiobacillus sp.]|nr:hypothetical protein [Thiobacillus sp.]